MKNSEKIRKLTTIAVLSALAYVAVLLFRIPIAPLDFLKYEPKDVIITIGGFIYGPAAAFGMSAAVSLIEMATISTTGFWGFLMNVISTGALIGLGSGIILSTAMMLLWNWAITPIYMGYPRSAVAAMLLPVFAPFNLIKSTLNASFTLLLYRGVSSAFRRAGLIPKSEKTSPRPRMTVGVVIASALCAAAVIVIILLWNGKL